VIAAVLVLHLLPRPGYGFHRDELLYIAMGEHLDFFAMQFPPMIAVLARLAEAVPWPLLLGTRVVATLALVGIMALTVALARRMGGGPGAQLLTALGLAAGLLLERAGSLFQPVVFELLWWTLAAYALVVLLDGGGPRWWLVLGLAMGLGGLTKFSAAVFGMALAAAVLFSPLRVALRTRWPWLAVLLGALIALPSVTGQVANGWPFIDQMEVLRRNQLERVTPGAFLGAQFLLAGAGTVLLLAGLAALLLRPSLRRFRPLAVYAAAACLFLLATKGKAYYLGPVHPPLIAAGAVGIGGWLVTRPVARRLLAGLLALGGLVLMPLGVPLLPPAEMAAYMRRLGVSHATETNAGDQLPLPQDYADMTGWREQVAAVAEVFHSLPDSEQARTIIVGGNYGRTGALGVYRHEFGLPYPVSRSGDFHHWGYGLADPAAIIIVGGDASTLNRLFEDVTLAGRATNPWGVLEERDVPIHICRKPREPLPALWARLGPEWG